MKILKLLFIALSLMILPCGCRNTVSPDKFQDIQKRLFELKAWKCTVDIKIANNKNTTNYTVNQYYLHPSNFRVEVLKPEFVKGLVTVSNGNETRVSNPNIGDNSTYVIQNLLKLTGNNMLITYFFSNYVGSEKSEMKISGEKYKLKTFIPNENDYMETEVLTINKKGYPEKLEMFDKQGRIKTLMIYKEFIMNPKLDKGLFE